MSADSAAGSGTPSHHHNPIPGYLAAFTFLFAVTAFELLPLFGNSAASRFQFPGEEPQAARRSIASTGFFETLGFRLALVRER